MSRTNIRILKINSNFIEIRVSEASAVRHGPNFLGRIWTFVFKLPCVLFTTWGSSCRVNEQSNFDYLFQWLL